MSRYVVGIDIGQRIDPTAVVVIDRWEPDTAQRGNLNVVIAERMPLGMAFAEQIERLRLLLTKLDATWGMRLVVDATSNTGVVEMMVRAIQQPLTAVTITAGQAANTTGQAWKVPKTDLIGSTQIALQNRKLRIAPGVTEARTLVAELKAYTQTLSAGVTHLANDPARAPHDDLVIAVALGVYVGSRMGVSAQGVPTQAVPYRDRLDPAQHGGAVAYRWKEPAS